MFTAGSAWGPTQRAMPELPPSEVFDALSVALLALPPQRPATQAAMSAAAQHIIQNEDQLSRLAETFFAEEPLGRGACRGRALGHSTEGFGRRPGPFLWLYVAPLPHFGSTAPSLVWVGGSGSGGFLLIRPVRGGRSGRMHCRRLPDMMPASASGHSAGARLGVHLGDGSSAWAAVMLTAVRLDSRDSRTGLLG